MKKIINILTAVCISFTCLAVNSFADNTTVYETEDSIIYQSSDEEDYVDSVKVTVDVPSDYRIIIPKNIKMSGITKKANYTVNVEGEISEVAVINIVPDETIDFVSQASTVISGTITQDKTTWTYDDLDVDATGEISAPDLKPGKWEGTFNFNISVEGVAGDVVLPTLISNDIDVYSAAVDEVYYLDGEEKKVVCTTDSNGHGLIPADTLKAGEYTFYSSIAKNPDNLDENYSLKTTLTNSSNVIDVMPVNKEHVLYWYGYKNGIEDLTTTNGWSHSNWNNNIAGANAYYANGIYIQGPNYDDQTGLPHRDYIRGIGSKNPIIANKIHITYKNIYADGTRHVNGVFGFTKSKALYDNYYTSMALSNMANTTHSVLTDFQEQSVGYVSYFGYYSSHVTITGLWYE